MAAPDRPPALARFALGALIFAFAGQIVLGHLVAFGLGGPLFAWHQDRVAVALWGSPSYGAQVAAYRGWIQALLGGTMISYAWAMLFLVARPLRQRQTWAAWAIAIATLNWFVIDTSVSAAHGVWVNVAFNAAALIATLIPLALLAPWLRAADRAVPR